MSFKHGIVRGSRLAKPFTESEVISDSGDKSSKSGDIWGDDDVALSYDHRDDLVQKHDFSLAELGCLSDRTLSLKT